VLVQGVGEARDPWIWMEESDSASAWRLRMSDLYWLTDEQMARLEPFSQGAMADRVLMIGVY